MPANTIAMRIPTDVVSDRLNRLSRKPGKAINSPIAAVILIRGSFLAFEVFERLRFQEKGDGGAEKGEPQDH